MKKNIAVLLATIVTICLFGISCTSASGKKADYSYGYISTDGNKDSDIDYYINSDGEKVQSPTYYHSAPDDATAICKDGTYSFSRKRKGTCSHHGGVRKWLNK
jgi:hypothetical protein